MHKQVLQVQHELVKNPNWWEAADQLAIYNRGRRIETPVLEREIKIFSRIT